MRVFAFVFVLVGLVMLGGGLWGMFGNASDYCEDFECSEIQQITEQEDQTKYSNQMGALIIAGTVLLAGGVLADGLDEVTKDGKSTRKAVEEIRESIAQRRQKS